MASTTPIPPSTTAPPSSTTAPAAPLFDTSPLSHDLDLSHMNVIIAGGTSGIGLEVAKVLCAKNAHYFILGSDVTKGRQALDEVEAAVIPYHSTGALVDFFECNLSSPYSIKTFVKAWRSLGYPVHCYIAMAGTFMEKGIVGEIVGGERREEGEERGEDSTATATPTTPTSSSELPVFELSHATNYLGHFQLVHHLLADLKAASPSRIIWMTSQYEFLARPDFNDLGGEEQQKQGKAGGLQQYARANLYALLSAREMNKRLKGTGIDVFTVQPGLGNTPLYDESNAWKPLAWLNTMVARLLGQSPRRAATSTLYAAADTGLEGRGGLHIGPPYIGPLFSNALNTAHWVPNNYWAHKESAWARCYDGTVRLLESRLGEELPNKLPSVIGGDVTAGGAVEKKEGKGRRVRVEHLHED